MEKRMYDKKPLHEVLREVRTSANASVTQEMVARALRVSRASVANWERGHREPSLEHLLAFAGLFGMTLSELLDRADVSRHEVAETVAQVLFELERDYPPAVIKEQLGVRLSEFTSLKDIEEVLSDELLKKIATLIGDPDRSARVPEDRHELLSALRAWVKYRRWQKTAFIDLSSAVRPVLEELIDDLTVDELAGRLGYAWEYVLAVWEGLSRGENAVNFGFALDLARYLGYQAPPDGATPESLAAFFRDCMTSYKPQSSLEERQFRKMLGARLRELRESLDQRQRDEHGLPLGLLGVARKAGIRVPRLKLYELGLMIPTKSDIQALAELYGVSPDYLLGRTSKKQERGPRAMMTAGDPVNAMYEYIDGLHSRVQSEYGRFESANEAIDYLVAGFDMLNRYLLDLHYQQSRNPDVDLESRLKEAGVWVSIILSYVNAIKIRNPSWSEDDLLRLNTFAQFLSDYAKWQGLL